MKRYCRMCLLAKSDGVDIYEKDGREKWRVNIEPWKLETFNTAEELLQHLKEYHEFKFGNPEMDL